MSAGSPDSSAAVLRRRISRGGRELVWVALGQTAYLAGVFAGMKLFTQWLPQEEYGRLALGLSIAGLASLFTFGPIGQAILRYFAVHRDDGTLPLYFHAIARSLLQAVILIGATAALAALLLGSLLEPGWRILLLGAAGFAIVAGLGDSLNYLSIARRWRPYTAFYQGAGTWLRILLAAAAVALAGTAGHWVLVGYTLGAGLSLLPLAAAFSKAGDLHAWRRSHAEPAERLQTATRELRGYAAPFFLFAGFAAISLYADRWVIQSFLGEAQVGLFFAVMQIANAPLALFFGILSQAVVPVVFDRIGRAKRGGTDTRLLQLSVFAALPIVALMLALGFAFDAAIIRLLTTPDYATVPGLLGLCMLSYALFHLGQLLVTRGLAQQRPAAYFWPKALQAVSFLALAPFFIQAWRLPGVAWALCASSALYLASVLLVNRRLARASI